MARISIFLLIAYLLAPRASAEILRDFFQTHCYECHDNDTQEGNLNLVLLPCDLANVSNFDRWVKIHDRVEQGEMPPKTSKQPEAREREALLNALRQSLLDAEAPRIAGERTRLRRLTKAEYENTIRDLFDMPGIALQGSLPADGSAHGFDKNADALDLSHVNIAKYVEVADHTLNLAIATRHTPPPVTTRRISLANRGGFVAHVLLNGDAVLLKDKKPDPDFPPAGDQPHLDEGTHMRFGSYSNGASVGVFRHEDEAFSPYFAEHVTIYPARYRVRTSLYSFQWDKGRVLPARGVEAARLSVVQLTGDGRGGQHPSYVLGYFDAPSLESKEHELTVWLNHNEILGFNAASLAPVANYSRKGRAMAFTGPGIACDWLDIEGPLYDAWPPKSHRVLFGDLPITEFKADEHPQERAPDRKRVRQIGAGLNRADPVSGIWTIRSSQPLEDAARLLADFLPRAFRRPVAEEVRKAYLDLVGERLKWDPLESTCRHASLSIL